MSLPMTLQSTYLFVEQGLVTETRSVWTRLSPDRRLVSQFQQVISAFQTLKSGFTVSGTIHSLHRPFFPSRFIHNGPTLNRKMLPASAPLPSAEKWHFSQPLSNTRIGNLSQPPAHFSPRKWMSRISRRRDPVVQIRTGNVSPLA